MGFTTKLPEAARRHIEAAEKLYQEPRPRKDVAGYLFGIAAECAIKQMVIPLHISSLHDKDKIHYAHFPELRTRLRDALKGRQGGPLLAFIRRDAFMNNWDIAMRYADASQIRDEWVDAWRQQARDVINAMGA